MDYQLAINDEKALRMWAIEQANGNPAEAREIEAYVKGDGNKATTPAAVAAE